MMALDRSPESISAQGEFELIFGPIEQNCDDKFSSQFDILFLECRKSMPLI